ncbi:DUF3617 family protein [Rhodanobacter sp. C01]|uniref:DUF3617 domain-containing protein n=1 Tax=Rhodanobacter sp. C01 TaxID=1945856 RepID=UPI0009868899|nr:DUF3617 family protein [Rhodanobacter sp. C01]OOG48662.1 hypothetical protein B0E50_08745 [Rhodanobacter sp. C01]
MNHPLKYPRSLHVFAIRHGLAFALLLAAGLGSTASRADPGDFQAMPGLWKTVTRVVEHGHAGPPTIRWQCVDEDADPWLMFADLPIPDASCQRSDQHRSNTALAWTVNCSGHPPHSGHGRVDFDSAEHYTASVELQDRGEVVRVEGQRYAACTGPSD